MANVLLVEDAPSAQALYRAMLERAGHRVRVAGTAREARDLFEEHPPHAVCLDLGLPDADGLELLRAFGAVAPETRLLVITADSSIHRAVEAMRAGAADFLVKPVEEGRLLAAVAPTTAEAPAAAVLPPEAVTGSSPAMRRVHETIAAVSSSAAPVFLTGESGTGKDIFARAVHASSPRAEGPFVPLACAALPPEGLESAVFGHAAGAFPGATEAQPGLLARASGGTLFLDGLCELDMRLQAKLVRVVQSGMIHPVGAAAPEPVDVRFVAATNRDPYQQIRAGTLREDLFYRLNVVSVHLPPLRERGEDVITLAAALLDRLGRAEGRPALTFAPEVIAVLRRHDWPGNVRELHNVIWTLVLLAGGPTITLDLLPPSLGAAAGTPSPAAAEAAHDPLDGLTLAQAERLVIERALARAEGSVPRAARMLDVAPSTLYRKRTSWSDGPTGDDGPAR